MQLHTFFATTRATSLGIRRGRKIHVQPTSVARRREGVSRGSGRQRAGRPLKRSDVLLKKAMKRKRSLASAVLAGHPNRKSHGVAH